MWVVVFIILVFVYFIFIKPTVNPEPVKSITYYRIKLQNFHEEVKFIEGKQTIEVFPKKVVFYGHLNASYQIVGIKEENGGLIVINCKHYSKDIPDLLKMNLIENEAVFVCGTIMSPLEYYFF